MNLIILNPVTLMPMITMVVLFAISLKGLSREQLLGVALIGAVAVILLYFIQITKIPIKSYDAKRSSIFKCMKVNIILIFLSFISALWLDELINMICKNKNGNSLDWFWKQII